MPTPLAITGCDCDSQCVLLALQKLAMETAEKHGSNLIIANDPDADRFAAAEKQGNGDWKIFNGNELGILFADWVWQQYKAANPGAISNRIVVLNTTVSSKMLSALAKKEGLYYEVRQDNTKPTTD